MIALLAVLNIVTTTPDLAALAREVAGPHATVTSLGRAQEDPHFIEPKPGHIVTLNRADVLVEVGMELEIGWLPALLEQTRNPRLLPGRPGRIVAGSVIAPLEVPLGRVDRSQGDVHVSGNPHFLLDPERAKPVARLLADRLKLLDPGHAADYDARAEALIQRLDAALAEAGRLLAPYRGAKMVTYHKSLTYLAARYGLVVANTLEPKPGIPPSPAHLASVIEQMKTENIRLIVLEPWHDRRVPALVAGKTGARVVELPVFGEDYVAQIGIIAGKLAEGLR